MDKRVRLECWTGSGWEAVQATLRRSLGGCEWRQLESWRPQLRALGEGDHDWNWRQQLEEAEGKPTRAVEAAALMLEGRVQGAILFWRSENASRLDGGPLIYVDRLATAPENRNRTLLRGRVRGSGFALMKYARERSRRLGCGGRVGLHSLSGVEGSYRKLGMREVEPRIGDDEGFAYFEWAVEELR